MRNKHLIVFKSFKMLLVYIDDVLDEFKFLAES